MKGKLQIPAQDLNSLFRSALILAIITGGLWGLASLISSTLAFVILSIGVLLIWLLPIIRASSVADRIPGYSEAAKTNKFLRDARVRHPSAARIKWITLLLGWTIVGWLVAAVMATRKCEVEIDQTLADLIKNPTSDPVPDPAERSERQVIRDQAKAEKARLKAEKARLAAEKAAMETAEKNRLKAEEARLAAEKAAMETAEKNRVSFTTYDKFKAELDIRGKDPMNGINFIYVKNTATGEAKLWVYIVAESEIENARDEGPVDVSGSVYMIIDGTRDKVDYKRTDVKVRTEYSDSLSEEKGDGVLMHALKLGLSTTTGRALGGGALGWVVSSRMYGSMRKYDSRKRNSTMTTHLREIAQGEMTLEQLARLASASTLEMRLNEIEMPPEFCSGYIRFAKSFREELLVESARQF